MEHNEVASGEEANVPNRLWTALRRRLPIVHYAVDCLVWLVALPLTTFSRYDFPVGELAWDATLRSWAIAVIGQGVFGVMTGLYTRRWRYGSFDEVAALAATVVLTGLVMTIVNFGWFVPERLAPYRPSPPPWRSPAPLRSVPSGASTASVRHASSSARLNR